MMLIHPTKIFAAGLATVAVMTIAGSPALAQDRFKVVIGNIINWENQALQVRPDIYKKYGIELETVGAQGAGETMQAVISGAADLGGPLAMAGVYRAFVYGAPIRILLPMFTGDNTFWYVKKDSPIRSLKDTTPSNTISFSTSGSTTDLIVTGFIRELGVKARPVKTGGMAATFPQVMSGQVDVGWAAPPFGLQEIEDGTIRVVGRGVELPSLRNQTVRALGVNIEVLKERKDALLRFTKAYREVVEWMYSDSAAIEQYAKKINRPASLVKNVILKFDPKSALQSDRMENIDASMKDAASLKFIDKPLTKEQIAELVRIPPR
jgi:NitT/TauT family transport system substrate-binding protein